MRDPNRIDYILKCLSKIWKKYPDLRLGQLIGNSMDLTTLYYTEDKKLINYLSKMYQESLEDIDNNSINNESLNIDDGAREASTVTTPIKSSSNKGRIYIHRGNEVKSIRKDEWETYEFLGYSLGKKDK